MDLAIEEAIKYPYRDGQWKKTVLTPGLIILCGATVIYVLLFIGLFLVMGTMFKDLEAFESSSQSPLLTIVSSLASIGLSMTYMPLVFGYFWEALQVIKQGQGPASLPEWDDLGRLWGQGVKLYLYQIILTLPFMLLNMFSSIQNGIQHNPAHVMTALVILLMALCLHVVHFLLAPFWLVPVMENPPDCSFGSMFNVARMIARGRAHYGRVLLVVFICILLSLAYAAALMVVGVVTCCVGFLALPGAYLPILLTSAHLLAQVYRDNDGEAASGAG